MINQRKCVLLSVGRYVFMGFYSLVTESSTESVNYQEMERMTQEMIKYYKRIRTEDECVGLLCRDIHPQIIAFVVAILETGASFVFLDAQSTSLKSDMERLNIRVFVCEQTILEDCMTTLDSAAVKDDLSFSSFFKNYRILERAGASFGQASWNRDIAFVAFSSGSTGSPKTIRIPFSSIIPNILDLRNIYTLQSSDTIYVSSPPTFDPCILDIFLALSTGCSLLFTTASVKFEKQIVSNILGSMATVCYMTPSIFLSSFPKRMQNCSLRSLILGGEPFPRIDLSLYPCLKSVNIYNVYGITEVSCWASISAIAESVDSSLGTPLSDTIFEVRDDSGNVLTNGVGELFIGSFNRICVMDDDESHDLKPCFRASGDLVEVRNGKYFYVGRTDRRVKIFGHKVDLALIDAEIGVHSFVKRCYSVFNREESVIITFVVPSSDDVSAEALENVVKLRFPYTILIVSHIPLNTHGKVCEDACLKLYYSLRNPRNNDVVHEFERLWRKYTSNTSNDLGFVECGGNSILALQFTTALSNFGQVPNDFIVALLSNVKYSRCRELISRMNTVEPTNSKRHSKEVEDDDEEPTKKIKSDPCSFGRLQRVMGRGRCEIINQSEDNASVPIISGRMKVSWKHDTTKCVDASPTVFVYEKISIVVCGSHSGQVLFVDVRTGDILTRVQLPDRIESSACVSSCGKFIFLGCYDHNVYCISVPAGTVEWTFVTDDMVKSSPVFSNDKLYFGSYDHFLYCVSRDGQLIWKTDVDESPIYATVVLGERIVVTTLGGTVAFLQHCGRVTVRQRYEKPFFSSPCAISRDTCVTIDVTGAMRAFNIISGKQLWQHQVPGNVFSSVSRLEVENFGSEKIVFGCHDKRVYCFDVSESEAHICWCLEVQSAVYATPFCFRSGTQSLVCVATTSGSVYVVNADSGTLIKSNTMKADVFSSPVVVGSVAIFGCRNNYLYALDIS